MPYRKTIFATNEIYHVVNRSIAQIPVFKETRDYQRALEIIDFYRYIKPPLSFSHYKRLPKEDKENFLKNLRKHKILTEISTFCLMPNHCHFLLKQNVENGISTFMRNFQNSYARYFNTKYKRAGGLFQSMFKAVRIETDEQFLHVSRYIHLNPVSAYLIENDGLENYQWSSFSDYINQNRHEFVDPKDILSFFKTKNSYKEFVLNQAEYQKELQKIKHLTLEE
ncbi:MAG: transposase [Patescibacteria group bacterium]